MSRNFGNLAQFATPEELEDEKQIYLHDDQLCNPDRCPVCLMEATEKRNRESLEATVARMRARARAIESNIETDLETPFDPVRQEAIDRTTDYMVQSVNLVLDSIFGPRRRVGEQ
jgi:hypothetical protein